MSRPPEAVPVEDLVSSRWEGFDGTVISEVARLAQIHGAVDLALGSPEFPPPDALLKAASEAIQRGDVHQYSNGWGDDALRQAIAAKVTRQRAVAFDPATEITVTCGATEGMTNVMMAVADPDDEVILFEPYYENYLQIAIATNMRPRFVRLHRPDWNFDEQELAASFNNRTKLIVLNTPHNPTGRVFGRRVLENIAELCQKWNVLCLSDEVYEHIVFDDDEHCSMVEIEGMRSRTAVVNSLSKTYSITGWRIGYVLAPPPLTTTVRKVHEITTCCAPAPLQSAAVAALELSPDYYRRLCSTLHQHHNQLRATLEQTGFRSYPAQGGYFLMSDLGRFGFETDQELAAYLISELGVAAIPGSIFYAQSGAGSDLMRFCFGKAATTLSIAHQRLTA